MKKIIAVFVSLLGISSVSHAGIMVEPFLGYETGAFKADYIPAASVPLEGTLSGTGYGLRLGYKFMMPWVALEYYGMSGKSTYSPSTFVDDDASRSALGLVAGVDIPFGLRAFAGYGFSNELTLKNTANGTRKSKGSYTKVGLGFSMLPLVSLNLEYIMNKYTKYDNGSGSDVDFDTVFANASHNTLFFSVSVPLNL